MAPTWKPIEAEAPRAADVSSHHASHQAAHHPKRSSTTNTRIPTSVAHDDDDEDKWTRQKQHVVDLRVKGLFVAKLYDMISALSEQKPWIARWSPDGTAFSVFSSHKEGLEQAIGQFFDHNSLASLRRQLNVYRFVRVRKHDGLWWYHPEFHVNSQPVDFARLQRNKRHRATPTTMSAAAAASSIHQSTVKTTKHKTNHSRPVLRPSTNNNNNNKPSMTTKQHSCSSPSEEPADCSSSSSCSSSTSPTADSSSPETAATALLWECPPPASMTVVEAVRQWELDYQARLADLEKLIGQQQQQQQQQQQLSTR